MALFSRKRRANVGTYQRIPKQPMPPLESQVDEGELIARAGVRMAVKNRAILWALRDHADFDHEQYLAATRDELLATAGEADANAERLAVELDGPENASDQPTQQGRLVRRRQVLIGLSERLRDLADDEAQLAGLALEARDAAWEEIGAAVKATALLSGPDASRPTGDDRDWALAQVRFDLEEMKPRRAV